MTMPGTGPDPAAQARALLAAGRREEASRLLNDAIRSGTHQPELLRLRGQLALDAGDLETARRDLEGARALAPDDPALLHLLGGVCHAQGDDAMAEACLEQALATAPRQAALWYSLGLVRHAAGRYQAALDAYGRALELAPDFSAAVVGRGKVWQILGDLDAARRAFCEVLERDPGHAEATGALAAQMMIRGEHEAGLALVDTHAARRQPGVDLCLIRARLLRGAGRPAEALASLQSLGNLRLGAAERCHLDYLLGDLHEQLGQHEAAFRNFQAANERKPGRFDAERHRQRIEATATAWSRAALDRLRGAGDASSSPIFIVGMPRSGTTLVEQIIAAHPDVHGAGELPLIGELARAWRGASDVLSPGSVTDASARRAAAGYLAAANPTDRPRFTDKMPANYEYLGLIKTLLPGARVVHCRRHPLDTAVSCYFQDFSGLGLAWSNRLEDIDVYYRAYRALMRHWREVLTLKIHDVDYERLVADPSNQIRRLLAFLDLAAHPDCLTHDRAGRVAATASYAQSRRPIYRDAVGRHRPYRRYLGPVLGLAADCDDG
jgi:tetratricopeptide (TPR) repeat protein